MAPVQKRLTISLAGSTLSIEMARVVLKSNSPRKVPSFFDWADQGLVFDIAVHFGSLVAVCVYFRSDIMKLIGGGLAAIGGDMSSGSSRLAIGIALGTIPAAVAGLLLAGWIEAHLRSPLVVVVTLAVYGVLLAFARA